MGLGDDEQTLKATLPHGQHNLGIILIVDLAHLWVAPSGGVGRDNGILAFCDAGDGVNVSHILRHGQVAHPCARAAHQLSQGALRRGGEAIGVYGPWQCLVSLLL